MSSGLIATRYAKALFRLCDKDPANAKKQLPALETLEALFATKDGGKVLRSPVMPPDLKKSLLDYATKQAGADDLFKGFVNTVADAGRIAVLPDVAQAFRELLLDAEGIVAADVVGATNLDQTQVDEISKLMGEVLGKKVEMHGSVDEGLLGGFVIKVGNYRVDMSLKSRIEELAQNAAQA